MAVAMAKALDVWQFYIIAVMAIKVSVGLVWLEVLGEALVP